MCSVCEEESDRSEGGRCSTCGIWQGESYTLEQSEKCAERLLKKEGLISRDAVDALLERSLVRWKPRTRKCDADAQEAVGLTLARKTSRSD